MKCPICNSEVVKQTYRNAYICPACLEKMKEISKDFHSEYFDKLILDYYMLLGCVRSYAEGEQDNGERARKTLTCLKIQVEEGRAEKHE